MISVENRNSPDAPWSEIAAGVYTWEAFHPEWKKDVRCAVYITPRSVVLIDPLVPSGRSGKLFWDELDRLVRVEKLPLRIILTIFYHERSAPEFVSRYGEKVRVWCPVGGRELSIKSRRFRPGVRLPAGIRAFPTARKYEVVLWIPRARVLFSGDAILGGKRRQLRLCPNSWNPKGVSQADVAESLEPIRKLPVQVVHVGHGSHVTSDAGEVLSSALDAARNGG